ncbi:siphovirus ReqiPepy6 Gp37-like family protein [Thermomonospora amylolytica]|uniref:siphovirus ReqiPepy6 Gp37-like family protein n=1 Tax=Thermomonospora amylolytica TaxID=1411117 RepID=UPI000E6CDC05|nr:siphovirus ReqiPepy6 Gp37-like family protein [Thermomonospora amylolytica]
MTITVLVTDMDLKVVGDPLTTWTQLDMTLRFNEPSSGVMTIPADPEVVAQLDAGTGRRIVIIRDGQVVLAGPLERPMAPYQRTLPGDQGGDDPQPGTLQLAFVDDLVHLAGRLVYPNPAQAASAQTASHYTATGVNAEVLMRNLVNLNAGPGALVDRRVPHLALGTLAGVGSNVSIRARFTGLLAELQSAALVGGGLGFRTRQTSDQILFEVYQPRDLTGSARYSWELGNLRSVSVERSAPALTHAIVGGQGEDAARTIVERADPAAAARWWRIEQWVDSRNEDTVAGLQQSGDEALAEGGETTQISAVTVDTEDLRFGHDVQLGDRATIAYLPGVEASDIVRQAQIQATPGAGEHVTVLIGSQEATADPAWVRLARRIQRRLARLETGTDVPAGP